MGSDLSEDAQKVWEQFWLLPQHEKDLLLSKMLAKTPITVVVGGKGQGGELTIYPRQNVTDILGDLVHRQLRKAP